jgi:hypothetical protein
MAAVAAAATACAGGTGSGGGGPGTPTVQAPDAGTDAPDAGTPVGGPPDGGVTLTPPLTKDAWTFFDRGQGLGPEVHDVTADEGGNVYVAGGDAVYAKRAGDEAFLRFDAANAGLTKNCNDPAQIANPTPPGPFVQCPVISVGGAAPGKAIVGFQGIGSDFDSDADWAMSSGGIDVVSFEGQALTRTRHVLVASPPHTICVSQKCDATGKSCFDFETHATSCGGYDFTYWPGGRRKTRQVMRIAVNHDKSAPAYGDVWMGGTHATLSGFLNNPSARGSWMDRTAGQGPAWADAKDVWEHVHPAISGSRGQFLTGITHAVAIDPLTGVPFGHNYFRLAHLVGYDKNGYSPDQVWYESTPFIDVWHDSPGSPPEDPPSSDMGESISFCDDGTLWVASQGHGIAHLHRDALYTPSGPASPDGASVTPSGEYYGLPSPYDAGNVWSIACDPDGSVWVGLVWGGVLRLRDGQFTPAWSPGDGGVPAWAVNNPLHSIQIDRWSTPRRVHLAFESFVDKAGKLVPGGVATYAGP